MRHVRGMSREISFPRQEHANSRLRELELAEIAGRQHGVVTRRQLLSLGVGKDGIAHRLSVGRLHRVFSGVYAVGHRALSREGQWMAAALASGDGAVLSHRSAAVLWGLLREQPPDHEVTIPRSTGPMQAYAGTTGRWCPMKRPCATASQSAVLRALCSMLPRPPRRGNSKERCGRPNSFASPSGRPWRTSYDVHRDDAGHGESASPSKGCHGFPAVGLAARWRIASCVWCAAPICRCRRRT